MGRGPPTWVVNQLPIQKILPEWPGEATGLPHSRTMTQLGENRIINNHLESLEMVPRAYSKWGKIYCRKSKITKKSKSLSRLNSECYPPAPGRGDGSPTCGGGGTCGQEARAPPLRLRVQEFGLTWRRKPPASASQLLVPSPRGIPGGVVWGTGLPSSPGLLGGWLTCTRLAG